MNFMPPPPQQTQGFPGQFAPPMGPPPMAPGGFPPPPGQFAPPMGPPPMAPGGFPPPPGQFAPPMGPPPVAPGGFPPPPGQYGPPMGPPPMAPGGFPPVPGQFAPPAPTGLPPAPGGFAPPQDNFAPSNLPAQPPAVPSPAAPAPGGEQAGADPLADMSDEEFAKMLQEIMGGGPGPGAGAGAPAGAPGGFPGMEGPPGLPGMDPTSGLPQGGEAGTGGLLSKLTGGGGLMKYLGYALAGTAALIGGGMAFKPLGRQLAKLPGLKFLDDTIRESTEAVVDDIGGQLNVVLDDFFREVKETGIKKVDDVNISQLQDDVNRLTTEHQQKVADGADEAVINTAKTAADKAQKELDAHFAMEGLVAKLDEMAPKYQTAKDAATAKVTAADEALQAKVDEGVADDILQPLQEALDKAKAAEELAEQQLALVKDGTKLKEFITEKYAAEVAEIQGKQSTIEGLLDGLNSFKQRLQAATDDAADAAT